MAEGQGVVGSAAGAVGHDLRVCTSLPSGGEGQRDRMVRAEVVKTDIAAERKMGQKGSRVKVGSRVKSSELNSSLAGEYARGSC